MLNFRLSMKLLSFFISKSDRIRLQNDVILNVKFRAELPLLLLVPYHAYGLCFTELFENDLACDHFSVTFKSAVDFLFRLADADVKHPACVVC